MEAPKIEAVDSPRKKKKSSYKSIIDRRTNEQVVALCGAIGSGVRDVSTLIERQFNSYGFTVNYIKASDLILEAIAILIERGIIEAGKFPSEIPDNEAERIACLQNMGDHLRSLYGSDIVSQLFVKKISASRQEKLTDEEAERGELKKESRQIVWILDSLKHPEEVKLLRIVYDKMFSLFGVLCSYDVKKYNLTEHMGLTDEQASLLIKRDEAEDFNHGQKLIKTLQFGDFFLRSAEYQTDRLAKTVERYVKIILGDYGITPSHDEYAMYLAQSAAFRSGCMSRQVGAAILNSSGEIVATGFNDPPQAGGGLYTIDSEKDARCFQPPGKCRNDTRKSFLKQKILDYAESNIKSSDELEKHLDNIFEYSGISDLTEYCRAVHAEMDAITSAARKGISLRNGTMFVTTYPCHNCAKHIIAAGIKEVYYIEPYEKSLASPLHNDAITTKAEGKGVKFLSFEGVAPRQYQNRFNVKDGKKADGKYAILELGTEPPAYAQLLDSFVEYEGKVVDSLLENGL